MVKGYLTFSVVTLFAVAIVVVFTFNNLKLSINNGEYPSLSAQQIVRAEYQKILANDIIALDGWVEIIDNNGKVVYTIGNVSEQKQNYTHHELIQLLGWLDYSYSQISPVSYRFDNYNSKYPQSQFYCSCVYFQTIDDKEYLCLVKIPSTKLGLQISFKNPTFKSAKFIYLNFIKSIILFIILYALSILLLGKWMSKKIKKPLETITNGIQKIICEDYSVRLNLSGENEFSKIGNTLNYMAEKIKNSIVERTQVEKVKQEILINISHDIKTPITTIQGYSKALLDDIVSPESKKSEYLECIFLKSQKITNLINIVEEYAKLDSCEFKLDKQKQDIVETIREAITICYDEIENKGINLELQLPDQEVLYLYDKNQFERVLYNLILNAVKYNPKGTCLRISLNINTKIIMIEIADDGIGIPEELSENIFKPFIRGDKARKSDGGTGLGLSISQKIIKEHGGTLTLIRNRGDEKTIFKICLPLEEEGYGYLLDIVK